MPLPASHVCSELFGSSEWRVCESLGAGYAGAVDHRITEGHEVGEGEMSGEHRPHAGSRCNANAVDCLHVGKSGSQMMAANAVAS